MDTHRRVDLSNVDRTFEHLVTMGCGQTCDVEFGSQETELPILENKATCRSDYTVSLDLPTLVLVQLLCVHDRSIVDSAHRFEPRSPAIRSIAL
jgi:hypothetical protein